MKAIKLTLLLITFLTSGVTNSQIPTSTVISNTPQCAADQGKPADSIFIALNLSDFSTLQINLSQQLGQSRDPFLQTGNLIFRKKIIFLSELILSNLLNERLPLVTEAHQIDADLFQNILFLRNSVNQNFDFQNSKNLSCYQVNEINSYYANLFVRGVQASTLEHLAKKILDPQYNLIDCNDQSLVKNFDVYPIFNLSVDSSNVKNWSSTGFDFWKSFKLYLSWAWRSVKVPALNEGVYSNLLKTIPIEEQVVLMPNGCKTITRPECSNEGISSIQVRSLIQPNQVAQHVKTIPSSSLAFQDFIRDENNKIDFTIQNRLHQQADDNQWIKTFQKNYQKFSQALIDQLFATNKLYSSLLAQKGLNIFVIDLERKFNERQNINELFYLCSETKLVSVKEKMNLFRTDHQLVKTVGPKLNDHLIGGLTVEDILESYETVADQVIRLCDTFERNHLHQNSGHTSVSDYKPWYVNYMNRFKVFKLFEDAIHKSADDLSGNLRLSPVRSYLPGYCFDAVDCSRDLIEGYLVINKVLLHYQHVFRTQINDVPLFAEKQEKVACGQYDPWEVSKLNRKKLFADIGSAFLFGWTNLPVYLDVNFQPKELVSFNKLVDDGKIRFDYEYKSGAAQKTFGVNMGSFLNVPCRLQVSQTQPIEINNNFVFNGMYVGACKNDKKTRAETIDGQIGTMKNSPEKNSSFCGQCVLSFSQVATMATGSVFAPIRFVLRLAESIMRYNAVKNNDVINPRQFNINHKYLIETYRNNRNSIPENCVDSLSRGYKCMGNICESRIAAEFEQKSGFSVESVFLQSDDSGSMSSQYDAWIKTPNCHREIKVNVTCSPDAKNFWMSYHKNFIRGCSPRSEK